MRYIELEDMRLSRIVLGTDGYGGRTDRNTAAEIMALYTESGGNVLDTARIYCDGMSEEIVGGFIKGMRERVYVSTKCAHPPIEDMRHSRLSREDIESDLDASLKALGTDYVDILWLHRDDVTKPVEPIIDALNEMVKKGKTRYFGASNWTLARIEEANSYAKCSAQQGFCASQALYNMADRQDCWDDTLVIVDGEEKERYDKSGFPLFAFSSQAKGFFEKYAQGTLSQKARDRYLTPKTLDTYEKIVKRARQNGDTISYTALEMLTEQSRFKLFPVIGPSNIRQLKSTLNIK